MRNVIIAAALILTGAGLGGVPEAQASDRKELCWVRINQETIYGQKIDGVCRFTEIRIRGEKLKSGRPFRPDYSEYMAKRDAEKGKTAETASTVPAE